MRTGRASKPAFGGSADAKRDYLTGSSRNLKVNTRPVLMTSPSSTAFGQVQQVNTRPTIVPSSSSAPPSPTKPSTAPVPSPQQLSAQKSPSLAKVNSTPFMTVKSNESDPAVTSTPSSGNNQVGLPASNSIPREHNHAVGGAAAAVVTMAISLPSSTPAHTDCSSPSSSTSGSTRGEGRTTTESAAATAVPQSIPFTATPDDQIKVAVRVRPLLSGEKDSSADRGPWEWDRNSIQLVETETNISNNITKAVKQAYQFDHLFEPEATNEVIFDSVVRKIVRSAMEGFHGSVFTYGQTSSGKTFTMNGDKNQPGIIPQAIAECFDAVNNMPGRDFILRVSYLEVYNEQIKDLLSMEPVPVRIQHDPKKGTVLTGVKEQVVLNTSQVLALIKSGEAHRHVGSTDMNEKSSRAHTLFKIIVESTSSSGKEPVRVSTLYLVDLAGSESAKMTNSKGERAREAKHINQSLLTLSTIIQRLSEDRQTAGTGPGSATRKQHLPYRDSKLTRILESALDGNAQIGIICTVSPTAKCVEETSNTLKFASRAKMIKMSAKVNETVDDKTLLRVYKEEIEQLRVRLQELEQQNIRSAAIASALPSNSGIGTLVRSDSASTINNGETSRGGASETEEEDANLMLQMITEMERLILRADVSRNFTVPGIARKGSAPQLLTSEGGSAAKRSAEKSSRSITSPPGCDTRSPRSEKRRGKEDRPRGTGSADAADAAFAGRGLVPKHLQAKAKEKKDPPAKNRNKNVFASSNIALLSMIVEATDSDNLVRIDTVEESENEYENEHASGTEPEEDSDISESELATSARPAVLEDIITASGPADMLMSASQDPAMDVQNVYTNTAADEVRPAPSSRVHADFFMPAPIDDTVTEVPEVAVSPEERAAFISADTTPGAPVVPRAGISSEKALPPPGALSAKPAAAKQTAGKQTTIRTPPPRIPKVPSMSVAKSSPGTSGIPRSASFRSRSITQRAMSMDSEAGGDECSLASHKLDSCWDEFDPRDSEIDKGGKFSTEEIAASVPAAVPLTHTPADAATGTGTGHPKSEVPDLPKAADSGFPPMTGGMIAARSGGLRLPIAEAEDDSVLLGVSKMLMVLRGHVSKTRSKQLIHTNSSGDLTQQSDGTTSTGVPGAHSSPSHGATESPSKTAASASAAEKGASLGLLLHEKFDYERLKLDFKLKEADNRFLQEELENKDRMLAMLTVGLKEVELSQTQWLEANQDLSYELEKALYQNKLMKAEIAKLKEQLHQQQTQTQTQPGRTDADT